MLAMTEPPPPPAAAQPAAEPQVRVPARPAPAAAAGGAEPAAQPPPSTRGRAIASDPASLEALHQQLGWTPGKQHIRPTPAVRERKERDLAGPPRALHIQGNRLASPATEGSPEADARMGVS